MLRILAGLSPNALLKHVLEAKMVLKNWRDSYSSPYTDVRLNGAGTSVSPPYMTCAPVKWLYAAYRRWRAHDREKIRTRPGIEVSLDTRVKALREAGGPTAEALGTRYFVFPPFDVTSHE